MNAHLILLLTGALFGLCAGSFAVTAGLRLARGESFTRGRSHCDGCGVVLGYAETLPVWSYLRRGGRGACCGAPIPSVHPVGEMAGLLLGLIAVSLPNPLQAVLVAALGLVLITTSSVDAAAGRLPDALSAAVAILCLALASSKGAEALVIGVIAAAIAYDLLEAARRIYLKRTGRGGLGGGDVKLFAALCLWLGLSAPIALVIAALVGLVYVAIRRPLNGRIAFGPALALGSFVVGSADLLLASAS